MSRVSLTGLVLAILISSFALAQLLTKRKNLQPTMNTPFQVGDSISLPEFLIDIRGNRVSLDGLVLLLFFDPNCGSCIDEAPLWEDLHSRTGQNLKIVGIGRGNENLLESFVTREKITYSIISDLNSRLFAQLQVSKVPLEILLSDRKIVLIPSEVNKSPSIRMNSIEKFL